MNRRRLLEELKELFGPAFGPALEAYGRSLAERLLEDERLVAEVRERFEDGRAAGGFPALSELLSSRSDEEVEEFFRVGWAREVLPPPAEGPPSTGRPWDYAPWDGDREAYREGLYAGMAFGFSDLRSFAREWLDELSRVGYYGMEESLGLPLKQQADDLSPTPSSLPIYGESFPVRLGDSGQTVWIRLDGPRSPERGYREILVSEEPLRTDRAILAAMTVLEGRTLDVGLLRKVLPEITPLRGESVWDRWTKAISGRRIRGALQKLRHHQALDYVLMLLRYHRPGFDDLPPEDRAALIAGLCSHVNDFLASLRKLVAFLEYGSPSRGTVAATRVAARDVKAAVLKDVDGLTYREIAKELGVPLPADFSHKGDLPTVRKMVGRGRKVMEQALGAEGWRTHTEAMKAKSVFWLATSEIEREAELEAEALGISPEEALKRLTEEERRDGELGEEPGIA
ncbi:MAG: hypothetical protein AB1425_03560 [Actinomycetota bacterium]